MLRTLVGIILFIWILGFATQFGGSLIHALLVLALAIFIYDLITSRSVSI